MTEIQVVSKTQVIDVPPAREITVQGQPPSRISVIAAGPPGPQGPPGPSGTSAASFLHTQASPSDVWIVNHNLGFKPNVGVYTVGGLYVTASIIHVSDNQTQIELASPMAGFARLI